jgi:hypothetical protein
MYTRPDGGVSIVIPAPKESIEKVLGPLTDAEYDAHVRERSIPADALNVSDILDNDMPQDREFRNAWEQSGITITHNLTKAKDIQLGRIRKAREPKLLELDKQFMIALEQGLDTSIIVNEKQTLRDITEPLKALAPVTIDDIKAAWPAILNN